MLASYYFQVWELREAVACLLGRILISAVAVLAITMSTSPLHTSQLDPSPYPQYTGSIGSLGSGDGQVGSLEACCRVLTRCWPSKLPLSPCGQPAAAAACRTSRAASLPMRLQCSTAWPGAHMLGLAATQDWARSCHTCAVKTRPMCSSWLARHAGRTACTAYIVAPEDQALPSPPRQLAVSSSARHGSGCGR